MIHAVIFDFGDVLLNYEGKTLLEKRSIERGWPENTHKDFITSYFDHGHDGRVSSVQEYLERVQPKTVVDTEEAAATLKAMEDTFHLNEHMMNLVRSLRPRYKTALLSNFTIDLSYYLEDHFKIDHLFDVIVNSYDVKIKKPNPAIYKLMLEKLGCQPEESVFIDDSEKNIKGAEAVGLQTIHFQNYEQCKAELEKILI